VVVSAESAAQFRAVFEAEYSYMCHSLRRLGVRAGDLEDVAHDAFIVVLRHLRDYDTSRPLRPWLFGIAYRVALDHRRLARHRREVVGAPPDVVDEAPGAEEQASA